MKAGQRNERSVKKNKGFTLAEVIIAASLITLFVSFIAAMGIFGSKTFKSGQNELAVQANLRSTGDFITSQVRNAEFVYLTEPAQSGTYNKIYYDSALQKIMYLKAGTTVPVAKSYGYYLSPGDVSFVLSVANGKYFLQFSLTAKSGSFSYPLSTKILLNNTSIAPASTGTAIYYKQPAPVSGTGTPQPSPTSGH